MFTDKSPTRGNQGNLLMTKAISRRFLLQYLVIASNLQQSVAIWLRNVCFSWSSLPGSSWPVSGPVWLGPKAGTVISDDECKGPYRCPYACLFFVITWTHPQTLHHSAAATHVPQEADFKVLSITSITRTTTWSSGLQLSESESYRFFSGYKN